MGANANSEVSPSVDSQASSGVEPAQTDQSGLQQGTEQPDASQDSLFQVPDGVTLTPEMAQVKAEWDKAYTQKRQDDREEVRQQTAGVDEIRNKADQLDALFEDPGFRDFINGVVNPQPQQNQQPQNQPDDFSKYGEQEDVMRNFVTDITKSVKDDIGRMIEERLGPITNQFARTQADTAWDNLKTWANDNSLPNPDHHKANIMALVGKGITPQQAYQAAIDLTNLPTKTPVNQPVIPTGQANAQPPAPAGSAPAGGQTGQAATFRVEETDPVKAAMQARRDGIRPNVKADFKKMFQETLIKHNQDRGTNVSINDL